jgi:C4-dicarboxylate-specific signal transduction histidine kinase
MDVTDQKYAETARRRNLDEIAHMNRVVAIGELTAALAHELNQPLAAILNNAQVARRFLSDELPDLIQVGVCLADIVADDKRAAEIIQRLRTLVKKGESHADLVDLNEVVHEAIRLLGHDAMRRQASIKFEPFPGLPPVLGDRVQLCQVVLNLLMNGLEAVAELAASDRREIVRTVEFDNGFVELMVEDSGKGIAEGDLARVFEPFFSTKPEGLGMGLSISRSIVQAHGGRIWAENNVGSGAVFHCVLPAAQHAPVASPK